MVAAQLSAAFFGLLVIEATGARTASHSEAYAYDEFRRTYRQQSDAVGVSERRQLFLKSKAEIEQHNSAGKSWTETVNKFTDYTLAEKQQLLGYRRSGHSSQGDRVSSSFLETTKIVRKEKLADAMDWGSQGLASGQFHRNQGSCGSCWAVAAVGAIEMHAELQHPGNATLLSAEQMIDCTPNPQHCGGSGGCHGATAELAFEYVKTKGIALNTDYPIDNRDDHCFDSDSTMSARVDNWIRLPENELEPLLETIATVGPVVVSLDASPWFSYNGGVFAGCQEDAIVNHAVLLTGYGVDDKTGQKYWRIRNSWGKEWGEEGHIRLLRHDNTGDYCGVDSKPQDGVGCDGGPETLPVCGMCGVLSDTSYPSEVSFIKA